MNWQQFDAVIFDMDGVVVDTEDIHFRAMRRTFAEYNITLTDEHFMKFVGHTTSRNVQDINEEFNVNIDQSEIVTKQRALFEDLLENKGVNAQPGFWSVLEKFKLLGLKTALCTSSTRIEADYMFSHILKNHAKYGSIGDVFDASVTSTDVTHRKPHPEPYSKAMITLQAEPEHCLVFEDSAQGMQSARAAGCGMLVALRHPYNRNQLSQADWAIDSLEELLTL